MQSLLRSVTRHALKPILGSGVPIPRQRKLLGLATRLRVLPRGVRCTTLELGGVPAQQLAPVGVSAPAGAVLFLHGGAYCVGSPESHRNLCSRLARDAGCTVYSLDYRLAPEHPFPAGLDDACAAWGALLDSGLKPARIVVSGDSAGGGLALALVLRLRNASRALPAALYLISPWVDLTLGGATVTSRAAVDPLIDVGWIRTCAKLYAGGSDVKNPLMSPLFADCAGLPPMRIDVGSDEVLLSDAQRFAERARTAGVEVDLHVRAGLWHDYPLFAGMMAAATQTVSEAGRWVRGKICSSA